jgi:hypothetical protein
MDEGHATTTLTPPLKLGITITVSLCITAAHCHQTTNFSNGLRILKKILTNNKSFGYIKWRSVENGITNQDSSGTEVYTYVLFVNRESDVAVLLLATLLGI